MKKAALTILSFFCIFAISGCGNSQTDSNINFDSTVQNTTAEPNESEETTAENSDINSTSESVTTPEPEEETGSTDDEALLVYFSATGTTKGVAERIASVTNADLYEIIPAEPYSSDDLDWHDNNSRTSIEMNDSDARPAIASDTISLDSYSTIYIGYPIWWGDAPRIMSTFVERYDFSNKTVIPFCTSGGSGIGRSGDNLKDLANSGNWLSGDRLDAGISESEIQDWINDLN
ncbi:MAG: flavodoxin [Ruminococcus sp.]|nr:flavodoxin [Ruminococcus sp.]